jgi:hypothetical protein
VILGPIKEMTSPSSAISGQTQPEQQLQDQREAQELHQDKGMVDSDQPQQEAASASEEKKKSEDEDDDASASVSLGLINTAPVQLKTDVEEPVTSGGMDTMVVIPGTPD